MPDAPSEPTQTETVAVRFLPSAAFARVPSGTGLVEAAQLAGIEIVTGCTRGQCGTDPVRVVEADPADALGEASERERATLERMGLDPADGWRLACSTTVRAGAAEVDVEAF
jgi:ferredoxin